MDAERRTFAPSSKYKFVREGVPSKEPIPAKKPRAEHYEEARRPVPRPIHKVSESKHVNPVKVAPKTPALYANDNQEPLPQRKTVRKPDPEAQLSKLVGTAVKEAKAPEKKQGAKEVADNTDKGTKASENSTAKKPDVEHELSSLMSSILHDEVQQIMIKVWQELPDDPPTEAEELVANKFRNEVGDDLQNAMGLSVTARLLNVHNPLYVKLHFSGKPEAGCLQEFIREHKITAFKRIVDSSRDTFAARFDHIADFDRFCVHKEVKCGSATVTIVPCYKYLSCPPSVKSIYAGNVDKAKQATNSSPLKQVESDKKEKVEIKKANEANSASNKSVTTEPNSKAVAIAPAKIAEQEKPKPEIKETARVPKEPVAPNKINTTEPVKITPKKIETAQPTKVTPNKTDAAEPVKVTPNRTDAKEPVKVTPKKADTTEPIKATPKKVETTEATKVPPTKAEITQPKKATPKKEIDKNIVDKISDKELGKIIDEMTVVDEMGEGEEGDEEMTDEDILALMSGGIVLDECSGSEEEK